MRCYICRWEEGNHADTCPRSLQDPAIQERFERGWQDGRGSKPMASPDDPVYTFGWIKGDIACDTWWNS